MYQQLLFICSTVAAFSVVWKKGILLEPSHGKHTYAVIMLGNEKHASTSSACIDYTCCCL